MKDLDASCARENPIFLILFHSSFIFMIIPFQSHERHIADLETLHKGKRVLLAAEDIYDHGKVPAEEEGCYFVYTVDGVEPNESLRLSFQNKCIKDGDEDFALAAGIKSKITNYHLSNLADDFERYNRALGRVNRIKNFESSQN